MVLDWALTWESLARDIFWSENGGLWVFGVENLTIRMQNINWKIEIQIYYYYCCSVYMSKYNMTFLIHLG